MQHVVFGNFDSLNTDRVGMFSVNYRRVHNFGNFLAHLHCIWSKGKGIWSASGIGEMDNNKFGQTKSGHRSTICIGMFEHFLTSSTHELNRYYRQQWLKHHWGTARWAKRLVTVDLFSNYDIVSHRRCTVYYLKRKKRTQLSGQWKICYLKHKITMNEVVSISLVKVTYILNDIIRNKKI